MDEAEKRVHEEREAAIQRLDLETAWRLYDNKKYGKAKKSARKYRRKPGDTGAEAHRIMGWCDYYLGLELLRRKGNFLTRTINWMRAAFKFRDSIVEFGEALDRACDPEIRISTLNGYSLSLRIMDCKAAYRRSDQGIREALATNDLAKIISAYNTRNILLREDKCYIAAIEGCQKDITIATEAKNYQTAGHGFQNMGDTYRMMIPEENDPEKRKSHYLKALRAYQEAVEIYDRYEKETGQKATAHIGATMQKQAEVDQEMAKLQQENSTL